MMKNDSYLLTILEYSKSPPSKISIETFEGIIIFTILDTKIFPKNSDLPLFLKDVFNLTFKDYVYNSRTLVIARVVRDITKLKKDELHSTKVRFFGYFKELNNINDKGNLSKWLQGLGGD